ncbi:LamG-like jellyroll fold domain-containing protein [Tamlana flava]|uniref:LamG-like jellyroll fold domain-containing protein n=1 Tax=Tamlana flava TaxID=3158572 RepID=UPI00351ABDC6
MEKIAICLKSSLLLICVLLSFSAYSQTQTFNTDGTFTVPGGVTSITVQAWGAGGGGSKITNNGLRGGGGGGGAFASSTVTVTPGASYPVVVGVGGYTSGNITYNGTSSTFNTTTVIAAGGASSTTDSTTGGAGGTTAASTGDITYAGGNGANGGATNSGGGGGGAGTTGAGGNAVADTGGTGTTLNGGNGGNGVNGNSNGNPGANYGAGGSGASKSSGGPKNGGTGANGLVIITWTCPTYSLTSTSVSSPICTSSSATVTLNGSVGSLPIGTYTVTYDTSAPNAATGLTSSMTVSTAGTGTFTTSSLANTGTTTITVTDLLIGSCSSTVSANNTADVTINGAPTITGTTPGSRVGTGTVNLAATASSGTINWYAAISGGSSLGTGPAFTTPSITTTTTYYVSTTGTCGTSTPRVAVTATILSSQINVSGLGNTIPGDGSNTPDLSDNTDFGKVQITSQTTTKTFVITNTGGTDITLGSISLAGPSEFSITSAPAPSTVISGGGTANVVISFATTTIAVQTDLLTIVSDDPAIPNYQINLQAEGDKVFFDSDGDGVYDDVDIDDDNDGIIDSDEENACRLSSGAAQADYKFLDETFGTGTTRSTAISTLYTASTTYCIEDGNSSVTLTDECDTSASVNDGEYTVHSFITTGVSGEPVGPTTAVSTWAWYAWAPIEDHTPGDTDGRMAIFNADYDPGIFYETEITGTLSNVPITYSFWVINLDNDDSVFSSGEKQANGHRILPEVTVNFLTSDRSTTIATFNTGPITRCSGDTYVTADHTGTGPHAADATYNLCATSEWKQFLQQFSTTETSFIVQFVNTAPGGGGNDLAIDDIEIRQTLCDMDHDTVADVFDLDSDNDGIPDVVEANPTAASLSEGKANLTGIGSWVDANGNGMHDSLEAIAAVDTDGDGIPDYIDLDSDNDGLFDVDEYGVVNSNDASFQNGDGDITGDGVGDGPESETYREKDSDGDGAIEGYGDGILDIYDFHEGNTNYTDSYGNNSQGTAPLYALDSDGDGIPDYKDPYNDLTSTYDIDTVEIYAGLPNTAGVLDSTVDVDGDGIMASRDGDDTVFGSPRNLDLSYSLYFDGRNDYVEDANVIPSGSATLMAFVKSSGANTNGDDRIITGQSDFYIRVNDADNTVTAVSEGIAVTSTTALTDGIWTHVAVTTEAGGDVVLFINGIEEARDTSSSGGISSASNFMIGRATTDNNYFNGEIDEVRVFDNALTTDELKRMVYQELDDTNSFNSGKIIPTDISATLGTNLAKYYKMDGYQDDILDDKKTGTIDVTGAKMYNFKDIYFQRAPLPYETVADGNWTNSANWLNGDQWDIMSKENNPDDASIVHIKNNITLNGTYDTQGMVGLIVDSSQEFTIEADKGLYNSWYLELNGLIDLEGESQLVQTQDSYFSPTSSGNLERDQQGYSSTYLYDYWCSPVSPTSNASYTVADIFSNVGFLTSGYNGTASPVQNADYWIWKYANRPNNIYAEWQHVRSTGSLLVGEGFTMKGPGTATADQNYILLGQPNNGDFSLPITVDNQYLIGNPYPSAMDANQFILDNISVADGGNNATNVINGALYFWDHFSINTHYLTEYQGGYAVYTLLGGTVAISTDARINASYASGTKQPERYIPVGQGFFVSAVDDSGVAGLTQPIVGGNILFKNSQRIFQKEVVSGSNTGSVFFRNAQKSKSSAENQSAETGERIRLMFDSPGGYHRQLLLGADSHASNNFDLGYDALLIEDNKEDMYWNLDSSKLIIQAVGNFNLDQSIPFSMKIAKEGLAVVKIDNLENIDANMNIFVHDLELNTYHNLKESDFIVSLAPGVYSNRFEITFSNNALLNTIEVDLSRLNVYFSNEKESIIVNNPKLTNINTVEMLNALGQSVFKVNKNSNEKDLEFNTRNLKTGMYIINLTTENSTVSKKVLVD